MDKDMTSGPGRELPSAGAQDVRAAGPNGAFFTAVNSQTVTFTDPTPKGERILAKAGFTPPADHVLIQLLRRGTRSIGLDETVDLRSAGTEAFRAFKSDRIYRYTLDTRGNEWGDAGISVADIRAISHVPTDDVLVLERDGADIDLKPGDVVNLAGAGTERLYTEKRLITAYYENTPREIPRGVYTTAQLIALFSVQAGYILEFINEEGQLTPLKPDGKLRVRDGMKFFEQVPCGGSS